MERDINTVKLKKWPIPENIGERGPIGLRYSIFSGIGHF